MTYGRYRLTPEQATGGRDGSGRGPPAMMGLMRLTDGTPRARLTLAVDMLALAAFVLIGMRSHNSGSAFVVFARTAAPLLVAWLACAFFLRTYRPPSYRSLAGTILVAVPVGVLARTAIVGSPQGRGILLFLGVTLLFLSLFLGTGRVIVTLVCRRSQRLQEAA